MTPEALDRLRTQITLEEADKKFAYDDATGAPPKLVGKLTIGRGWNLTDRGIPQQVSDLLYEIAMSEVINELDAKLPWWTTLDEVRQRVLADMCYNLGIGGLLGFRKFLASTMHLKFVEAAAEGRGSAWFTQVKGRGVRLMKMMETGQDVS